MGSQVEMNQVAVVLRSPLAAYARAVAALPACQAALQARVMAALGPLAWRLQCRRDAEEAEEAEAEEAKSSVPLQSSYSSSRVEHHCPI